MDCFGDESVTGKVGSDLKEAKCTWVTCKALERLANEPTLFEEFQVIYCFSILETVSDVQMLQAYSEMVDELLLKQFSKGGIVDDLIGE